MSKAKVEYSKAVKLLNESQQAVDISIANNGGFTSKSVRDNYDAARIYARDCYAVMSGYVRPLN